MCVLGGGMCVCLWGDGGAHVCVHACVCECVHVYNKYMCVGGNLTGVHV